MARLNIDDAFWDYVQNIASLVGDYDKVLAQAMRLLRLSQDRFKNNRFISRAEYDALKFYPEFIGMFIIEVEPNLLQYVNADKEFAWLRKRKAAGKKGGERRINNLDDSKPQANPSNPKPLTLPIPNASKEAFLAANKFSNWEAAAEKVLQGLQKHSSYASDQLKEFLGDDLFRIACNSSGGIYSMRVMPLNNFTVRDIAARLKAAAESTTKENKNADNESTN